MRYVDAGYIIAFAVLFLYAVSLIVRRRRLERAVAIAARDKTKQYDDVPDAGTRDGRG